MAVEEARRDWERPLDVTGDPRFRSRCWSCSKRAATAPATETEAACLKIPVDVELCSDCACKVPEGWEPDPETVEKIAKSRTVVVWQYGEERVIDREKDRKAALREQQYRYDSEEYGSWK
jgi:hypothetical protein